MQLTCPARQSLDGQGFDVLVIGGGINGIAIARECAYQGKRVAVVEQNDFASGVTSRSTRIIHGGLRYLEHGEVGLVRESLRERERLLRRHPNLVRPLQFLLALSHEPRPLMRSAMAVRTGLWLYHHWAGAPRTSSTAARAFEQQLDSGHRWTVFSYEDAQCEFPERLIAEWLADAVGEGAVVRNYTRVLEIVCQGGRVNGARLRDRVSGQEFEVKASHIVNAAGPWVDSVLQNSGFAASRLIGGVRGSHIVLPPFTGAPHAALYTEALDGRPFFVIPWNDQVLVGTTEVADSGDPGQTEPAAEEIDYLFDSFTHLFPSSRLTKADVRYTFAGVRPLPYSPGKKMSDVTRQHVIHDHCHEDAAGLISIIGGKLTTAMSLAREAARAIGLHASEPANIHAAPASASGIEATLAQWAHQVACRARIPEGSAHAIAEWHGSRALAIACAASLDDILRSPLCSHSKHIVAEAVEAVMHECAVTLADILLRRVPVALGPCWSESCTEEAAARIGVALGWDRSKIYQETDKFEQERANFLHPKAEASLV